MAACWVQIGQGRCRPSPYCQAITTGLAGTLNCRTQKEGETGNGVSGDILEHSGDSWQAVAHVDSNVALALAGVCSNRSAQQTEKSVDAQQYEATQPL